MVEAKDLTHYYSKLFKASEFELIQPDSPITYV